MWRHESDAGPSGISSEAPIRRSLEGSPAERLSSAKISALPTGGMEWLLPLSEPEHGHSPWLFIGLLVASCSLVSGVLMLVNN